jgi:hypothetical protein
MIRIVENFINNKEYNNLFVCHNYLKIMTKITLLFHSLTSIVRNNNLLILF